MNSRHLGRLGILIGAALFVVGCGGLEIKYQPVTASAPAPVKSNVALKVVDARPAEHGGSQKTHVGNVRGSFGIPQPMNDKHLDVAPHTVTDATKDALGRVGVGGGGGPKTLVATITDYWMDGFVGYAAKIAVQYQLVDASGKALWSGEAHGGSGGTQLFSSPNSVTKTLMERALTDLAAHAAEQFASPPFQQALLM